MPEPENGSSAINNHRNLPFWDEEDNNEIKYKPDPKGIKRQADNLITRCEEITTK